eukprot:Nitzschia sp. Nitz4//scaffold80_size88189//78525//80210//NITZ4_005094-RA/size88189-augustus-gene-0.52-mRNA-1//-1//CDS//3329558651//2333//frame0
MRITSFNTSEHDDLVEKDESTEADQWVHQILGNFQDDEILQAATNRSNPREFDQGIAVQMNKLSLQERERTYEEIHGVSGVVHETPELLSLKLLEIGEALETIHPKVAYDVALEMDRTYIESPKFRLMFLRAERFNAPKAAQRLALFLEKKLKFFGRSTLVRPILLADLSDDDIKTLGGGAFQILPSRDKSGRPIVFKCSNCGPKLYTSFLSYVKCWWYSVISLFEEDEETQKRGCVAIVWWMDYFRKDPDVSSELRQEMFDSFTWLPMRPYNSVHLCMDDTITKHLLGRVQVAMSPPSFRYCYRIHKGSTTEVLYAMLSYGIPMEAVPVTGSGAVKTKDLQKWIARRKSREAVLLGNGALGTFNKIELPTSRDVLLAKGRPYQNHPGNQEYLEMVHRYLVNYETTKDRKGKRVVASILLEQVKLHSRFLLRDQDGWWVEATDSEALDRVVKAFTHAASTKKKAQAKDIIRKEDVLGKRIRLSPEAFSYTPSAVSSEDGLVRFQGTCF